LGHEPLLPALASEARQKIKVESERLLSMTSSWTSADLASLQELITNLNATSWALSYSEQLTVEFDKGLHTTLMALARRRDTCLLERIRLIQPPLPPALPSRQVFVEEGADPDMPASIILDFTDLCVVHKPPGWEVDCSDVGSGILLSTFLQRTYSPWVAPLVHYEEYQFGMVHRLDRVSSGLLLVGKTFAGYHSLVWQLNTGRLQREYIVAVHGWVAPDLRLIDAKVFHIHAEGSRESRVTEQGRPSQTRLTTLGHYSLREHPEDKFSVIVVQIRTGRRHQIRTHLAHVGHPTVADGKYMPRECFLRDRQWCDRNFLHRYRLSFGMLDGTTHEALAALPKDLRAAAAHFVAADSTSALALAEWLGIGPPKAWKLYTGLPCGKC